MAVSPSGGGRSGDVVLVASQHYNTLTYLVLTPRARAHGRGACMAGGLMRQGRGAGAACAHAVGFVVQTRKPSQILHDFTENGDRFIVAKGGRGGKTRPLRTTSRIKLPPSMKTVGRGSVCA